MNITELRIGNIIYFPTGGEIKIPSIVRKVDYIGLGNVISVNPPDVPSDFEAYIKHCAPIPITEEWLLKFGFEKPAHSWICDKFHLTNYDRDKSLWCVALNKNNGILTDLRYVHQLQNLYFALTGNELILK